MGGIKIVASGERLAHELDEYLKKQIDEKSMQILDGVPEGVYRERLAYLSALRDVFKIIPELIKRAKE